MAYTNIDDPSAYFQTALYTGNGGTLAVTNDGNSDLQPDLVWIKKRSGSADHPITDSNRGTSTQVYANLTYQDDPVSGVTAFNTDGFTLGSNGESNLSGATFVAWQWKANGGTTSSNTDGVISSTVQANQDAGFSIVTYTGNGSTADQTVGHGLGVRANAVLVKNRDSAANWVVYADGLTVNHSLELNTTDGQSDSTQGRVLSSSAGSYGTSSIFTLRNGSGSVIQTNTSGEDYVAYCFAEKQGYSKFGSYKGNSSTDGTFVYLGFKPRWLMIKSTQAGMYWDIIDSTISTSNVMDDYLTANTSDPQGTSVTKNVDFLSNGFKWRYGNNTNFSDHTYIYMAFAENPFVTSTGIPTTAR
jgi:hypothetical protein